MSWLYILTACIRVIIIIIIIIIIWLIWKFFPPVLTDGFSLEFDRQQVYSSFQDSSQYYDQF